MDDYFGESQRLIFRQMSYSDFDEIARIMRGKNVEDIWEYYFRDIDVKNWIKKNLDLYNKYNSGYFIATEKINRNIVGQIGIMPATIDGKNYYEIGYILKEEYIKNGYATEGAKFMVNYAFNRLKLNKVIFEITPNNKSSINIATKLGAKFEGTFEKLVNTKQIKHNIYTLRK